MLSIKPLKSAKKSHDYFFNFVNYYTSKLIEGREENAWYGKLAEKLALTGGVNSDTFELLLQGKLPNGEQLGNNWKSKRHHRPGTDLTFCAPKSVSILWQLGGDERLLHAHSDAVKGVLDIIEKECATARIVNHGKSEIKDTESLLFALFHHDTSRLLDPHLHTHAVMLNMTERDDGKIRALGSQKDYYGTRKIGTVEHIQSRQHHFGLLYRFVLAEKVTSLGYEIRVTHSDGRFEIEGVPQSVIKQFSKRRVVIEENMQEKGLYGGKAALNVTMQTRPEKKRLNLPYY